MENDCNYEGHRPLSLTERLQVQHEAAVRLEEARQKASEISRLCARASKVGRRPSRVGAVPANFLATQETPRL